MAADCDPDRFAHSHELDGAIEPTLPVAFHQQVRPHGRHPNPPVWRIVLITGPALTPTACQGRLDYTLV